MKYFLIAILFLLKVLTGLTQGVKTLEIGSYAPDFKLKGIDNQIYSLSNFSKSKVLVIIFTDNICPTSQAYEDRIIKLAGEYKNKPVSFVAINPNYIPSIAPEEMAYSDLDNSFEDMKKRAADKLFPFPYLFDCGNQEAANAYGPVNTPHVFVFDSERKLRYSGRIDNVENPYNNPTDKECKEAIDAVLNNKTVEYPNTRPFGCPVKWKSDTLGKIKYDLQWGKKVPKLLNSTKTGLEKTFQNNSNNLCILFLWPFSEHQYDTLINELVLLHRMYNSRYVELVTICYGTEPERDDIFKVLSDNKASVKNYFLTPQSLNYLGEILEEGWSGKEPEILLLEPGGTILFRYSKDIRIPEIRKDIIQYIGRFYADN